MPLTSKQKEFCSPECYKKDRSKSTSIVKCELCGKEIKQVNSDVRKYCSPECTYEARKGQPLGTKEQKNGYDRPYTKETGYLIRLWHSKGDSKVEIAQILERSLESVEKAFV
jgi:hypothetical protein